MVFAAGVSYLYIAGAALTMLPLVALLVVAFPYRRERLMAFLNPWDDPLGSGFQIIQSFIAVGTGGITGRGLMNGVQKLFYLPEPHTGLHLRGHCRGTRIHRCELPPDLLLRDHLARAPHRAAGG